MNLGLRDAVYLAPVLLDHMKKSKEVVSSADLKAVDDATLQSWASDRHEKALKVIAFAKSSMKHTTWKNEFTWYLGVIPINWVWVRNFLMWFGRKVGITRRKVPWQLSGLMNR